VLIRTALGFKATHVGVPLAKPNYRQQKKQKEQARLTRQAEKLKRRTVKLDELDPSGAATPAVPEAAPSLKTDNS